MDGEDLEMGKNYASDDKSVAEEREERAWVYFFKLLDTKIKLLVAHFSCLCILGRVY